METCAGCGSPIAPNWKYCIHCGIQIERPRAASAPEAPAQIDKHQKRRIRVLMAGGIGIFVVGVALLVIAGMFFAGIIH
jgi:predicted nucleic acid-binding Zn ribbon protein